MYTIKELNEMDGFVTDNEMQEPKQISDESCIARQIRNFERCEARTATLAEKGKIRDEYFGLSIK